MSVSISLIVPIYNMEKYLGEFLESLRVQTFTDFETVLVDDGSTDKSGAMLDEFAKVKPHVKVIHKENGGSVSARKRGIAESCGKYLCFADPDDLLVPEMLATYYRLITENDVDMVVSANYELRNGERIYRKCNWWGLPDGVYEGDKLESIKKEFFGNGSGDRKRQVMRFFTTNKIFKRELIADNLDYTLDDVHYGDDFCMILAAVYDCKKLAFSSEPLYIYRIRESSITRSEFSMGEVDNVELVYNAIINLATEKGYMYDCIKYAFPIVMAKRLLRLISRSRVDKRQKKAYLAELADHPFIKGLNIKKARKYMGFGRCITVRFLKLGFYSPILAYYKKKKQA